MPVNKKDSLPDHYEKKLKECFQPTETLMASLCNKWVLKVLFALEENSGPMRFNKIREVSGSTSDKMMNNALNDLQDYKLVCFGDSKETLGYSLTNRGRSILKILHKLEKWVDDNKQDFAVEMKERLDGERKRALKEKKEELHRKWVETSDLCENEPFCGYQNPKLMLLDAEMGDVDSMYLLGVLYENGTDEDIEQDYTKAMEWYKKAAKKRDVESMYAIAILYEQGKGVERNLKEAKKWMQKAANFGNENAIKWLEKHNEI